MDVLYITVIMDLSNPERPLQLDMECYQADPS